MRWGHSAHEPARVTTLPWVVAVTDLASALRAISTIVTQGEGAGSEQTDSHFSRFCRLGEELAAMRAADPTFEPAWPAATNLVMNPPVHSSSERVHISQPQVARWLDIGNAIYTASLRCPIQGFGAKERRVKATWLAASFALMRTLVPVGQGLAARPANDDANGPHAGLTFTPLRTLAWLPQEGAAALVAERLGQLRKRALDLPLQQRLPRSRSKWSRAVNSRCCSRPGVASTHATACWTHPRCSKPTRRAHGSIPMPWPQKPWWASR
jgi:hypothetical protein